jgi:hypothetical protein
MSRQKGWPVSFARNLVAGAYGPFERVRRVAANLARRSPTQVCCGNYGDPGC